MRFAYAKSIGLRRLAYGGGSSASEQLLALATDDGWTALYDPTNPDTRTLRDDGGDQYFSAIADGLGNLPDLAQGTAANQPQLSVGAFGQLDGGLFSGDQVMATAAFAASIDQPLEVAFIFRNETTTGSRGIFDANSGGRVHAYVSGGNGANNLFAGTVYAAFASTPENNDYVASALFNGASSQLIRNGINSGAGDAGANSMANLRWGDNQLASAKWIGPLGLIAIYEGDPGATKRQRMLDKLHELSGVAQA